MPQKSGRLQNMFESNKHVNVCTRLHMKDEMCHLWASTSTLTSHLVGYAIAPFCESIEPRVPGVASDEGRQSGDGEGTQASHTHLEELVSYIIDIWTAQLRHHGLWYGNSSVSNTDVYTCWEWSCSYPPPVYARCVFQLVGSDHSWSVLGQSSSGSAGHPCPGQSVKLATGKLSN